MKSNYKKAITKPLQVLQVFTESMTPLVATTTHTVAIQLQFVANDLATIRVRLGPAVSSKIIQIRNVEVQ